MMLGELIDKALRVVPLEAMMAHLAQVAVYDRYQASHGIGHAAEVVAQAARDIGLQDVASHRFPANGHTTYWTFQSPVSWTPTTARIDIRTTDGQGLVIDHFKQPFFVATYSAPTPAGGIRARLVHAGPSEVDLQGAVALLEASEYANDDLMRGLTARGAIGFITDGPCCTEPRGTQFSGRIELEATTPLFGFSVTSRQFRDIVELAICGAEAHVVLDVDRSAPMPVATAVLSGDGQATDGTAEIWLTAHLCHPRPGANDNASGVAALLGAAATLAELARQSTTWQQRRRTIRFVWAPEFVGTAAILNARMQSLGDRAIPHAVINLDMVGEDQSLCECPFVVERSPECRPTLMVPVAEHIVEQVFARTATHGGNWRSVPFLGYSDHALFAGPHLACPAVQFSHWPDRFNHSAADTLDKVSPAEMRRAVTAAVVLAFATANDYAPLSADLRLVVHNWCMREQAAANKVGDQCASHAPPGWAQQLQAHVCENNARLLALLNSLPSRPFDAVKGQGEGVEARWSGPINLRAMMASLTAARRAVLWDMIRADKRTLALLANFAVRADGRKTRDEIVAETSFAMRRPIDEQIAMLLFSALFESGWLAGGRPMSCDAALGTPTG
jgi:hypothetical protein